MALIHSYIHWNVHVRHIKYVTHFQCIMIQFKYMTCTLSIYDTHTHFKTAEQSKHKHIKQFIVNMFNGHFSHHEWWDSKLFLVSFIATKQSENVLLPPIVCTFVLHWSFHCINTIQYLIVPDMPNFWESINCQC